MALNSKTDRKALEKTSGTRVFWRPEEWTALAQAVDQLLHDTPSLARLAALQRAQHSELKPERHRGNIAAWSVVQAKMDPLLQAARIRREENLARARAALVPPVKTPEQLRQEKLSAWVAATSELFAPLLTEMLKQPAVAGQLELVVRAMVARGPTARPPLDTFSASFDGEAAAVVRPKILVAGLLPAQAHVVCADLSQLVDFRFWGSDESKNKLKALARNCEVAVGVTNFLSHSAEASLKSLAPRYVPYTGGISRLKDTLREVATAQSRPAAGLAH